MDQRSNGLERRLLTALLSAPLLAIGCASPGPPRSPSLNLPQPVSDLAVSRTGDRVELSFTLPHLSTDKLPLFDPHRRRPLTLHGTLCRELTPQSCLVVATLTPVVTAADRTAFTWQETLPEALATGSPRLLGYRVEFMNHEGRSAGRSNVAYTTAGQSPATVAGLQAEGTRGGVLLQWTRDPGTADILIHRIDLATALAPPVAREPALPHAGKALVSTHRAGASKDIWLNANSREGRTLDASVNAGTPYRYTAERRLVLTLDQHTVELRSGVSAAVEFTLHPVYAPPAPAGLEATGFTPPDGSHFAVDLIWQPVSDAGITRTLAAPLAGYNVYRERLEGSGGRTRLTPTPALQPGFHDATADPAARYRYSVTAIDGNGNESKAATFVLEPSPQ